MFWSVSTYPGPMLSSTIRLDSPTFSFLFVTSIELFTLLTSVLGLDTNSQWIWIRRKNRTRFQIRIQNNYLCTYDLYGPVRKFFDAGR